MIEVVTFVLPPPVELLGKLSHKRVPPRGRPSLGQQRIRQENISVLSMARLGWNRELWGAPTPLASSPFRGFWTSNTDLFMLKSFFQHPLVLAALTRYYSVTPSLHKPSLSSHRAALPTWKLSMCPAAGASTSLRVPAAYSVLISGMLIFLSANEKSIFVPQRKLCHVPSNKCPHQTEVNISVPCVKFT